MGHGVGGNVGFLHQVVEKAAQHRKNGLYSRLGQTVNTVLAISNERAPVRIGQPGPLRIDETWYMMIPDPVNRGLAGELQILFNVFALHTRQNSLVLTPAPVKELFDFAPISIERIATAAITVKKLAGMLEIPFRAIWQRIRRRRQLPWLAPGVGHLLQRIEQRGRRGLSFIHDFFLTASAQRNMQLQ